MIITYTKQQMLAQWKLRRLLEPLRSDCRITRSDGVDLDAYATRKMRLWYLDLLANAPVEMLATTDISANVTVKSAADGTLTLDLPDTVMRVVRVRLEGWKCDATLTPAGSTLALRQRNRFACGGVEHPVAVVSRHHLELYSAANTLVVPAVELLKVVVDPGEEVYRFDERAWSLL
jgi:hypothetical protein